MATRQGLDVTLFRWVHETIGRRGGVQTRSTDWIYFVYRSTQNSIIVTDGVAIQRTVVPTQQVLFVHDSLSTRTTASEPNLHKQH